MESQSETTQMVSALKLPVIVNGDLVSSVASASTEGPIPPKTAEQRLARKNKLKAKNTLMLAIPDEHLLKFHVCKDTKSLWEEIKNMFEGNKESKKTQKTILKQNYENFVASSQEGLDKTYDRLEAIRLFFAYTSFMRFIMYQMDVKSVFLYGTIEKVVYVCQPLGFEDLHFHNKVYKVEKYLYGLHQAPRAWYKTLSTYSLENRFRRGIIDKTLFIKKEKGDILLVQVYIEDIIFGSTKKSLCIEFKGLMHKKFQMSSIGELSLFFRLQVMQRDDRIFINQDKYVADILKKFDFFSVKTASTLIETNKELLKDEEAEDVDVHLYRSMIRSLMYLTASRPDIMFDVCACARFQVTPKVLHLHTMKRIFRDLKGQPKLGLWYPRDSPFDLEAFSDSDYAGASLDKKSTIGGCQFHGKRLISWQCKKQIVVANSTTEAEYVAVANCCAQFIYGISDEFRVKTGSCKVNASRPSEPQTPSSTAPPSHEEKVTTVASQPQKNHTPRQAKRGRDIKIPQFSGLPKKVGDEVFYIGEDD
nr:putative ribonuclease H-like domain-containing protein [Tanacetum cinerariifolium]